MSINFQRLREEIIVSNTYAPHTGYKEEVRKEYWGGIRKNLYNFWEQDIRPVNFLDVGLMISLFHLLFFTMFILNRDEFDANFKILISKLSIFL